MLFARKTGCPCSILNTVFPCSIIITDQYEQNTEFFSLKCGSLFIDLNSLEKALDSYFCISRSIILFLFLLKNSFLFSVFLRQSLRCGPILPTPKLKVIKIGLFVIFAKKMGFLCYILNTGFSSLILNTDQHGQNTEFSSLKCWSLYIDLNRLEQSLDAYILHFAQCYFSCNFFKFFSFMWLGQLVERVNCRFKNGLYVLSAIKIRVFRVQ